MWWMILAESTSSTGQASETALWVSIGTAFTAIIAAGVSAYIAFKKEKRTDDTVIVKELKSLITRGEKNLSRLQGQLDQYEEGMVELREEHAMCQIRLTDLYGWLLRAHDWMRRQANVCRELGRDPGELPDLPPHPVTTSSSKKVDFTTRTLQQGTELIKEMDKRTLRGGERTHEDPDSR